MEQNNTPDFEKLVNWIEGQLSEAEAAVVTTQVAASEKLQADVAWLRVFHQRRKQTVFVAPPPALRAELNRRFAAQTAETRRSSFWEQLTAALKFDSYAQPATARVRSLPANERQLVYTTSRADIALTIQLHTPDKLFHLYGQILPAQGDTTDSFTVQLIQQKQERWFTVVDEVGEFVLEKIPDGEYELVIGNDQYQIILPLQLTL